MKNWLTRQFVHQRWSNLYFVVLLTVFLFAQALSSGLAMVLMFGIFAAAVAPPKYNIGDRITAWEKERYPL